MGERRDTMPDAIAAAAARAETNGIRSLFEAEPDRFETMSRALGDMILDVSKTAIDADALQALFELARERQVEAKRDAMFAGARINETENRSVLHVALRARPEDGFAADGEPVGEAIESVLAAMSEFAEALRSGTAKGATGKPITDVVNIGIGGSDLGPAMATLALRPYHDGPRLHYVSNVDGAHLADTLAGLTPETTLFIVACKTFTTIETMTNALKAGSSASGTGSAGAIRSGRPSACP